MSIPIIAEWDGEVFKPLPRHAKTCAEQYVIGERYFIDAQPPASEKSRRFFHAQLADLWRSLPEEIAERWPTVESFRKAGLIACGYAHKTEAVCATNQQAQALAASYGRMNDYAVVEIRDRAICIWVAKSQKRGAMSPDEHKAANRAVLEWAAAQIGVAPDVAERESGMAA